VVAKTKAKAKKRNAVSRYIRDTRSELKKVNWPSKQETWRLTQIVLVVTVSMAIFLGVMDWLFSKWLGGVLASNPWWIGISVAALAISTVAGVIMGRQQG